MFARLRHILEMIRFSHTLFALPFAALAAMMAWHQNAVDTGDGWFAGTWRQVLGILLCMVFARSAAMAMNRLLDASIDAGNPRTAGRHLPAGILTRNSVAAFTLVCSLAFVGSTLLFLPNRLPLYLAVPVLLFLFGYTLTKRFTSLAHFWLGAALALSPMAAWIAIRGNVVLQSPSDLLPTALLAAAIMLWVAGFDMIYACQDAAFDQDAGLHSIPARWGVPAALRIAAVSHLLMVVLLGLMPLVYPAFGWVYLTGIVAVAVLLIYEHGLVRPEDLTRVNLAFFHVNVVVSLGLFCIGAIDLLL